MDRKEISYKSNSNTTKLKRKLKVQEKKRSVMPVSMFLLIEVLLFLRFLYLDFFQSEAYFESDLLKLLSILLCTLFALYIFLREQNDNYKPLVFVYKKKNMEIYEGFNWCNYLLMGIVLTFIADYYILACDKNTAGVIVFCGVQLIYLRGLENRIRVNMLVCLLLTSVVLFLGFMFGMVVDSLVVVSVFYFFVLVGNVFYAIRKAVNILNIGNLLFAVGMVLFLMCDVNVGFYNLTRYIQTESFVIYYIRQFSAVGMWMFYLPSQVLIVLNLWFVRK